MQPELTTPLSQQTSMGNKHPLPGDLAIWIFILAELAVFAVLFIAFALTRLWNPELFSEGHQHLNQTAGLINTLALITSSYFVVMAVEAIKRDRTQACARWLWAALAMGGVYVLVKSWEYQEAFAAGYTLRTNTFYTFYYFLTFFHFAHVLLGMVILAAVLVKNYQGAYCQKEHTGVETGASYWHMVDLLWVILFPLVYVIH